MTPTRRMRKTKPDVKWGSALRMSVGENTDMTVTGAAADSALNQKLKINQVAAGDTVKAYRLIEYDATFNGYTFYASFETFLEAEKNAAGFNSLSVQEYFTEKIGTTGVAELLGKYAAA